MGPPTPAARGVRAVELTADEAYEYERLAHSLLDEALFEYDHFVNADRRRVNTAQWKQWRHDDDIVVYRERHAGDATSDSLLDQGVAPPTRFTAFSVHAAADAATATPSKKTKPTKTPRLLAVGTLASSLDDVMYGVITPTAAAMRLRASYTSSDDYLDGAVLAQIRVPTPSEPFQFVGIKWMLQRSSGGGLVRPRDFVFLESTGVQIRQDGSGQRVGFHIMHSVEIPEVAATRQNAKVQRGAFSTCYLYHELANGAVDVYLTAVVQPRGNLIAPMAVRVAASMLTNNWRALSLFAENKKLAWLLETHRQLHHAPAVVAQSSRCGLCSKSFKGFTKRTKRVSCQLCSMTVCSHCSMARTLRSEGFARGSVVATPMQFCKKCIALAGEESASEIARQQLWENEVVRTGRAHTQTALALARRDLSGTINGSRLHHQSLSMGGGFAADDAMTAYRPQDNYRSTWHDTDPGSRRFSHLVDATGPVGSASAAPRSSVGKPSKSSVSGGRRTLNSSWNSSGRNTETLSVGTLNYRASSFQDPAMPRPANDEEMTSDAGRASTTSSALVLLDDRKSTRRMKALDYIPKADDASAGAMVTRSSIVSSSVYTDVDGYDLESVYSETSSIAVLDVPPSRADATGNKPLTITEEEHEPTATPRSELEAFYLEQQRLQKLQQQQLLDRQQQMQLQMQHHAPRSSSVQYKPQQQPEERRSVRFQDALTEVRDSEIMPRSSGALSSSQGDEQRLSYQMQLWLQMNELRDTAESTYQITQRNTEAIASQNPTLFRDMRFFAQRPLGGSMGMPRRMTAAPAPSAPRTTPPPVIKPSGPPTRPLYSPMSMARRSSTPMTY